MKYAVTVIFRGIEAQNPEEAQAVMREMLQHVNFTSFEVVGAESG